MDPVPPPVGETAPNPSGQGGMSPPMTDGGSPMGGASSTDGDGGDTTAGDPVLMSGLILEGDGGWPLPMLCVVRFYSPRFIDPATGNEFDVLFEALVSVDAFPYAFTVFASDAANVLFVGDQGYVATRCDLDNDQLYNEAVGWYLDLPLDLVTLPATSLNMALRMPI